MMTPINIYFTDMKKLHFGCGQNILSGWDNLDLPGCDTRKPLTYSNNSIDFIFTEHMIEHLDEIDGFNFMSECFRILKPGGVLRISCPSIDGVIDVYQNWKNIDSEFTKTFRNRTHFINHVCYGESIHYNARMFTIDNKIHQYNNGAEWHRFLYDKEDFLEKLTNIGFTNISFVNKHESEYKDLQNLERRVNGYFKHFPQHLDITLEATK